MAHEIDLTTGKAAMAYVGDEPWHGLGQSLTPGAPLETWQSEAGMDWKVLSSPAFYVDQAQQQHALADRRILFRDDTKAGLGVVSNDYKVVQPSEIIEFFRDLTEAHGFTLETAGCLFGGRKFWALAKTGQSAQIVGVDEIKPYLLLATSCDGSMATAAHLTTVRVVCNNTLRMSIGANAQNASVRVIHTATFDPDTVKDQLGLVAEGWATFVDHANALAKLKLDHDAAIDLVAAQLKTEWKNKDGNEQDRDAKLASSALLRNIIRLYDGAGMGSGLKSANGTAWGLLNAVTEQFDHVNSGKDDPSRAFERAHLTDRAAFKVTFANKLLALVA